MMKKLCMVFSFLFILIFSCSFILCNSSSNIKDNENKNLIEDTCKLDSKDIAQIYDLKYIDGKIMILCLNKDATKINYYTFNRKDKSLVKDKDYELPSVKEGYVLEVNCASISNKGDILISYRKVKINSYSNEKFINEVFTASGNRKIEINKNHESDNYNLEFIDNCDILYIDNNNKVMSIDSKTLKEKKCLTQKV